VYFLPEEDKQFGILALIGNNKRKGLTDDHAALNNLPVTLSLSVSFTSSTSSTAYSAWIRQNLELSSHWALTHCSKVML
jgi:hypothetical protein